MSQTLELADAVYHRLLEAAKANGQTPETWIAARLPKPRVVVTPEERQAANARLWQHQVSLGHPSGIDNEQIDADLAAEYANDHSPQDSKEPGN